jgi:hypothetical protein
MTAKIHRYPLEGKASERRVRTLPANAPARKNQVAEWFLKKMSHLVLCTR